MILGQVQSAPHICSHVDFSSSFSSPIIFLPPPARVCTPGWPACTVSLFSFFYSSASKIRNAPHIAVGLDPSTAPRRAVAPMHSRCSAPMWPQHHRVARHSTPSQSLKPPLTATLPHNPPLIGTGSAGCPHAFWCSWPSGKVNALNALVFPLDSRRLAAGCHTNWHMRSLLAQMC